jgi:hypothetical protein
MHACVCHQQITYQPCCEVSCAHAIKLWGTCCRFVQLYLSRSTVPELRYRNALKCMVSSLPWLICCNGGDPTGQM